MMESKDDTKSSVKNAVTKPTRSCTKGRSRIQVLLLVVFVVVIPMFLWLQFWSFATTMDSISALTNIGDESKLPTARSSAFENVTNSTAALEAQLTPEVLVSSATLSTSSSNSHPSTFPNVMTFSSSSFKKNPQPTSALPYTWNEQGCQVWPKPTNNNINNSTIKQPSPKLPPTGIVVSLAYHKSKKIADNRQYLRLACQKLPTQFAYFLQPQRLDMLLLWDVHNIELEKVIQCLELIPVLNGNNNNDDTAQQQFWQNADGTNLTTFHYQTKTRQTNVFVSNYTMAFPHYIQQNMSILQEPMLDCTHFDYNYIQGTRFFSDPILHFTLVEQYEYFIKIDLDIEFNATMPFNILWDMKQRGALFGHAGEFPNGLLPCTKGMTKMMQDFAKEYGNDKTARTQKGNTKTTTGEDDDWSHHWKGPCSAGLKEFDRGRDQYYTNLIVMNREFFYSPSVRAYGRFMNEYQPGWFKYRWGDQKWWHIAMGMFLGPDFRQYVADYTDLRCRRYTNCWFHWKGDWKRRCQAPGGIFHHDKNLNALGVFNGTYPNQTSPLMDTLYENAYRHNCSHLPENE